MYNLKSRVKRFGFTPVREVGSMAKNLEISILLDFYADLLTDKQKEFARLYYNEDLSLAEIAEMEDITRQGVRDALKRAEHILTNMEQTLGVAKNFMEIREKLADIVRCAQEIQQMDTGGAAYAGRIIQDAQELLDKY